MELVFWFSVVFGAGLGIFGYFWAIYEDFEIWQAILIGCAVAILTVLLININIRYSRARARFLLGL